MTPGLPPEFARNTVGLGSALRRPPPACAMRLVPEIDILVSKARAFEAIPIAAAQSSSHPQQRVRSALRRAARWLAGWRDLWVQVPSDHPVGGPIHLALLQESQE